MLIKTVSSAFDNNVRVCFVDPLMGRRGIRMYEAPENTRDLNRVREAVRRFMDDEPLIFKGTGWTVVPVDVEMTCDDHGNHTVYWLVESPGLKELRVFAVEAP